jgi:hypothetical protein
MIYPQPDSFVCITFDASGQLCRRQISFGQIHEVAEGIHRDAQSERHGYELGGAVIAAPSFYPAELSMVLRDALAIKLSGPMARFLTPDQAAQWCRKETAQPPPL